MIKGRQQVLRQVDLPEISQEGESLLCYPVPVLRPCEVLWGSGRLTPALLFSLSSFSLSPAVLSSSKALCSLSSFSSPPCVEWLITSVAPSCPGSLIYVSSVHTDFSLHLSQHAFQFNQNCSSRTLRRLLTHSHNHFTTHFTMKSVRPALTTNAYCSLLQTYLQTPIFWDVWPPLWGIAPDAGRDIPSRTERPAASVLGPDWLRFKGRDMSRFLAF